MKKRIVRVLAVIIFLCGCGIFLYPTFTRWKASYESDKVMKEFEKDLERMQKAVKESNNGNSSGNSDDGSIVSEENNSLTGAGGSEELGRLYEDMQSYNVRLYEDGQTDLKDPFSYEAPSFDLRDYGFKSNVIGILSIPEMEVELPVYLGASKANMAKGAAALGGTSMPIGGENTNVVLAAHRGYKGIKMFRDIEVLEPGDKIYVTTPWDKLVYQITEIKIVQKDDIDEVLIREGKDMLTLLTCHPYTKNSHRYLVFAEHVGENDTLLSGGGENNTGENDGNGISDSAGQEENTSDVKNISDRQIWLETYLPVIGGIIIVVLIIIGIVVTREKKED